MKTIDYKLPSHWASALINDDWTGYEDYEIYMIEDLLKGHDLDKYFCLDVADDSEFMQRPSYIHSSYGLLAGDYSTFTFQLR